MLLVNIQSNYDWGTTDEEGLKSDSEVFEATLRYSGTRLVQLPIFHAK